MPTKIKNIIHQFSLSSYTTPLALLILCFVGFGILFRPLGFYWDDFPPFLVYQKLGIKGLWDFYRFDRPFSAWTFIVTIPLLGRNPLTWQVFTLLMRWVSAVCLWWGLTGLWPRCRRQATLIAFLFAIYPIFTQQYTSVAYSQHWLNYALYLASISLMIHAVRKPRSFWWMTTLSLAAMLGQLSITEYFIGVELLRPIFLWLVVGPQEGGFWKRLRKTMLLWLPYLLLTAGFIIWRLYFVQLSQADPNRPYVLYRFFRNPIKTVIYFMPMALKDLMNILVVNWYSTVEPAILDTLQRFNLLSLGMAILCGIGVAVYLCFQKSDDVTSQDGEKNWPLQALVLGACGMALGALPAWLIGQNSLSDAGVANRYALGAMFGAAIFWVGLFDWFARRYVQQVVIVSILVCLAVGFHLRNSNDYYWRWGEQARFYWQLAWRAPQIKPNTPIVSENTIFYAEGNHSTANAINLMYPQPENSASLPYWIVRLASEAPDTEALLKGMQFKNNFRNMQFEADSSDSLLVYYDPEGLSCLWVVNPDDKEDPDLPWLTSLAAGISNLDRIESGAPLPGYPPTDIFGAEPAHNSWCYFYEKADLARQMGEWEEVVALGEQARASGFQPLEGQSKSRHEWLPFIEGYARAGRIDDAKAITEVILEQHPGYVDRLCSVWKNIKKGLEGDAAVIQDISDYQKDVGCSQ